MGKLWDLVFHSDNGAFPTDCLMRLIAMAADGSIKTNRMEALSCLLAICGWVVNQFTDSKPPVIGESMKAAPIYTRIQYELEQLGG